MEHIVAAVGENYDFAGALPGVARGDEFLASVEKAHGNIMT